MPERMIVTRARDLLRSRFARDAAVLSLGTAIGQAVLLVATPLLARLFAPAQFGMLAITVAIANIVSVVATLRYETVIVVPDDDITAYELVVLSSVLAGLVSGSGIALAIGIKIAAPHFLPEISTLWMSLSVGAGGLLGLSAIAQSWFTRKRRYVLIAAFRTIQPSANALFAISLGLLGVATGLLVGQVVTAAIIGSVAAFIALRGGRSVTTLSLRRTAAEFSNAPKYTLPTAAIDIATMQLPIFFITQFFGSADAGHFSMAWRILAIPMSLLGAGIGQVFFQRFALVRSRPNEARELLYRTWAALFLIGIFPLGAILICGEDIFRFILGAEWARAGKMASLMAPMLFAMLVSSPTSGTFIVLGLQKFSLIFGLSFLIYRVACLCLGAVTDNLMLGLAAWTICELTAIVIYNAIALRKLSTHEVV